MRHFNYKLRPVTIDNAKPKDKRYSLVDGGGLQIEINPGGSKTWRFAYRLDGKQQKVTIGEYPAISIKEARDEHERMRAMVERGESPALAKRVEVAARKEGAAAGESSTLFRPFALAWIDETLYHRSETYRAQMKRWLITYVFPQIGEKEMDEVTPAEVLQIIEDVRQYPVTAERIRTVIQQVYNYGIRKLKVNSNPAAPLRGAIVVPPAEHARHLSEKELGAFWRCLDMQGAHATTILASKLLMLTMARKMELLKAKKAEFDLDAGIWDVPAARMKKRRPHRVFLSLQAVDLLRQLFAITAASEYVVPSIFRISTHMGEATLNHFFKRMDFGVEEFSPHGLRGTAATILREHGFRKDVVELLLSHVDDDRTAASYVHLEAVEERKRAMQYLADLVDRVATGGEVIALRA